MNKLNKYTTDTMKVGVIEEDGISIIYLLWSVKGEVISKSIVWIPSTKLEQWLDTEKAHQLITYRMDEMERERVIAKAPKIQQVLREVKTYNKSDGSYKTFVHIETGTLVTTSNVASFCREYELSYGSFKKMARGGTKSSQGWALIQDPEF